MESRVHHVLRTLQHVASRLERAGDLTEVHTIALSALVDLLAVGRAAILVSDGAGLRTVHTSPGLSPAFRAAVDAHVPWALDAREPAPVYVTDVAETAPTALRTLARAEGIGALAFFPLTRHGHLVGALLAVADRPRAFGDGESLATGLLAALVAAHVRPEAAAIPDDGTPTRSPADARTRESRSDAIAVFAKGVAHDFNNLLTAIVMNLGVAERRLEADHPARPYILAAIRACDHAKTLPRQLHAVAQGGAPVNTAVTALPSLLHASSVLAVQGSPAHVTIDVPGGLWPALADEAQIGRVVQELVTNAHHAMPDGGAVHVTARNVDVGPDDPLPLPPGRYVEVSIHDQGPGVPTEHLSRVFEPYFSARLTGKGLGLATSHAVLHRHGGHITAESPPGGGARFVFHLPAAEDAPPDAGG